MICFIRHFTVIFLLAFLVSSCKKKTTEHEQPATNPQWSKLYGGTQSDAIISMKKNADGSIIAVGGSYSNDGDISLGRGNSDAWVIKLDQNGNKLWSKTFGGTLFDVARDLIINIDGTITIAGETKSNNGDISGNNTPGNSDAWVLKLDANGNKLWSKVYGGLFDERFNSIASTSDGGYVLSGYTSSPDGEIPAANSHSWDGFIMKIDGTGNKIWSSSFDGTEDDILYSVVALPDGGFVAAGSTYSNNGDFSTNKGGEDGWVIKVNAAGQTVWSKLIGGTEVDRFLNIKLLSDGNLILTGCSASNNNDVSGNNGEGDFWLLKINGNADKIWSKCYGSSEYDEANEVINTSDNGFLVVGFCSAGNKSVSAFYGQRDAWILKTDNSGNKLWEKNFGSTNLDIANSVIAINEKSYIVGSYTFGSDTDISNNKGQHDGWIFKISTP